MLRDIRIYSSDPVWRHILSELDAVVLDAPDMADVNIDDLSLDLPIGPMELRVAILNAMDGARIIAQVFGHDIQLPRAQRQVIIWLKKTGGMSAADLRIALGYAPDATTHAVDTAIYQLRRAYGHDFIQNNNGIYCIGHL